MSHYKDIQQGDIWYLDFEPVRGHELGKVRPALVLSSSEYNTASGTVYVVPISSGGPRNPALSPLHILVKANKSTGLKKDSYINITQIRSVSRLRFERKLGILGREVIKQVSSKLLNNWDISVEELM